ncbi:ferredoxin--NADP reductase [Legionella sp. km772]|uniref:ferredoxin--NADP reductase n=1 Tax=Legionella sp. km772 TaxID=2498111 RepID=UPI000F8C7E6F|nr:ferredoxin--NADP reductase [Legionella sp. km772]RUR08570.1 ferredoxin--NADP reductase [Legionella sp. km772]
MQLKTFPITLQESYMISPKVKHFIFSCTETPAFSYLPGHFITIHFEHEGKQLKRSYSIANPPKEDNRIEFAAGYVEGGPGTQLLFNLKPGDQININGPFGRLLLKEQDPKRYVLVATSTGTTPYRAMINELSLRLKQQPSLKVVILQGVQRREEVLYGDEFLSFAQSFPEQVIFKACLSKMAPEELNAHEHAGYVQFIFPELHLNPEQDLVYLCGNPGMIDEAFNYLKDQGFAMQQLIREKYISR